MRARWSLLARLVALAALAQRCAAAPQCGLVVIEAGAPRTGSTQQARLVLLALQELGLGGNVSNAGYFQWAEHAKLDAEAAAKHAQALEVRLGPRTTTRASIEPAGALRC